LLRDVSAHLSGVLGSPSSGALRRGLAGVGGRRRCRRRLRVCRWQLPAQLAKQLERGDNLRREFGVNSRLPSPVANEGAHGVPLALALRQLAALSARLRPIALRLRFPK
jgi:hypothetical protein